MDKFKEIIQKHRVAIALAAILVVAVFLRLYNLESWLFFQADQARDLNLVARAINNGPEYLPLLGPKAGGTFLRLGPVFYYFEYLSALIFGLGGPAVMAYPDLLFSILSIPLLFLFLKEFFSKKYSLLLTAGYAVCFFEIQYARFAWNPNSLPFFNLLFFYAVFKLFQTDSQKAKTWWSILIGISYAIVSQLHFVSLLSLPIALAVIFLIRMVFFKNKREKLWKYAGIIILICVVFYIPAILSDIQTDGNNALNFLKSLREKGDGSSDPVSLLSKDIFVFSKYLLVILSGIVDASKLTINIFSGTLVLFALAGIFVFKKETNKERRFFIALVSIWFISYFITYIPLGSKLQPRHFLVILPLSFIFVGALAYALEKTSKSRYMAHMALAILMVPIITNAYSMKIWFAEIADSQKKVSSYRKSSLLKSVGGESWWHLERTAEFMRDDCEKNKVIIIPPKESYRSLYDYAMEYVGEKRPYGIQWGSFDRNESACFYAIGFAKNDISDRFGGVLKAVKYVHFGDVAVTRFDIVDDPDIKNIRNPFKKSGGSEIEVKYFSDTDAADPGYAPEDENAGDGDSADTADGMADSESFLESVGREERLFWKDLFDGKTE
ncbi:MAG: hypothetical protein WC120_03160 [Parcubacteria group bacterium]